MMIYLNNMTGDTEVKVYDLNGNIIDNFVIDEATNAYPYIMPKVAVGVYNFVFKNGKKTFIKKVVIK